jgi:RES domain-containing protein
MVILITAFATDEQIQEMSQTLVTYIKLAVDIRLGILAGGGVMHVDCESVLLEQGSQQADVWGADWNPTSQQVTFESLINIRPAQNNPSLEVLDPEIKERIQEITVRLLDN